MSGEMKEKMSCQHCENQSSFDETTAHAHEHKHDGECDSCCAVHEHKHDGECDSCCAEHEHEHESGCDCCSGKRKSRKKTVAILSISLVLLVLSFFKVIPYVDPAWLVILLCGKDIFVNAFKGLTNKKITSALLISVAMLASIALEFFLMLGHGHSDHGESYIFAAGEVAFLMFLGEVIEQKTVQKSRDGVKKLASLLPENAKILRNGKIEIVPSSQVRVGDVAVVYPNEKIPADGVVLKGESAVDNSMITGESMVAEVSMGDAVYAGTWNGHGELHVSVTKNAENMAVAQLIKLTKEARGKKAPIARIADKWASKLVPSAILLAGLVFLFAYYVLNVELFDSVVRGVSVLVVFCPCALTLATPTAVSAIIGAFSGQGVLVKSGEAIEKLAEIQNAAFDKTGTLTLGKPAVVNCKTFDVTEEELFDYLKSAESVSSHPIARAILDYSVGAPMPNTDAKVINGIGVSCMCDQVLITVAKRSAFLQKDADADQWEREGKTVIGVEADGKLLGFVALADTIRKEAKATISALQEKGILCALLTGDNEKTAEYIGKQAGVLKVEHSLMPQDKTAIVEEMKKTGSTMFVGDGVNDTPSLATADVGVSMSVLGSDIATQNADVSLFTEDLGVIPWMLSGAKKALFTIKGNMIMAMAVNFAAILLSAWGILSPVTGALLHNVTSVLVVLNSCRLLSYKR